MYSCVLDKTGHITHERKFVPASPLIIVWGLPALFYDFEGELVLNTSHIWLPQYLENNVICVTKIWVCHAELRIVMCCDVVLTNTWVKPESWYLFFKTKCGEKDFALVHDYFQSSTFNKSVIKIHV